MTNFIIVGFNAFTTELPVKADDQIMVFTNATARGEELHKTSASEEELPFDQIAEAKYNANATVVTKTRTGFMATTPMGYNESHVFVADVDTIEEFLKIFKF